MSSKPRQPRAEKHPAIHLYTDGACSGNPGEAGIGIVLLYKNRKKEHSEHIGTATNNIAELTAIKRGLELIKNRKLPVIVYSDSSYAIGVLSGRMKAKKNLELIAEVKELIKTFSSVKFTHIYGHRDNEYNETADRLATSVLKSG